MTSAPAAIEAIEYTRREIPERMRGGERQNRLGGSDEADLQSLRLQGSARSPRREAL